jgi:hypothetical protein
VSIAVYDNKPYVAYIDAGDSNKPKLAMYNGTSWTTVDVDSVTSTDTSIAMNGSEPHIMYTNSTGAFVKKYSAGSIANVGITNLAIAPISYNKLIVVSGIPYAGYYNGTLMFLQKYTLGTDTWAVCGSGMGSVAQMYLALAANDTYLYASFKDNGTLMVNRGTMPTPSTWTPISPSPAITADFISSVMYSGLPAVAFRDGGNSSRATVIRYDGTSAWNTLGTAGFSEGSVSYVSLTIFDGDLHVAFRDESTVDNKLTAMRFEKGSWVIDDIPRFTLSGVSSVSLAGGSRKMFVAFSDNSVSGKLTVMEY